VTIKKPLTPEEAKKITEQKQVEAEGLKLRFNRVVDSLKGIQQENGFAPRMEIVFRGIK
jgi:hypothetical protein